MRFYPILTLALALFLSACGFHLRGLGSIEFSLTELNFTADDSYSPLARAIRERIETQGVEIHEGAPYALHLGREENTQRVVSFTAGTRSAEHMLTSAVNYEIRSGNLPALITGRAEVQRAMDFNQNNVSASDEENHMLREEMRSELVTQVLLRLQAIKPAQLDKLKAAAETKAKAETEAKALEIEQLQRELNLEPLPY